VLDVAVRGADWLTLMQPSADFSQQLLLHSHDSNASVDVEFAHANVVALATSAGAADPPFRDSVWVLRKVMTATAQRFTLARTRLVSADANTRASTPRLQPGNVSRYNVLACVFAANPSLALSREDAYARPRPASACSCWRLPRR
jgi:hypothetical protein